MTIPPTLERAVDDEQTFFVPNARKRFDLLLANIPNEEIRQAVKGFVYDQIAATFKHARNEGWQAAQAKHTAPDGDFRYIAPRMVPAGLFRVWDSKHSAWWREGGKGYTKKPEEAGLFDAADIANRNSNLTCRRLSIYPALTAADQWLATNGATHEER